MKNKLLCCDFRILPFPNNTNLGNSFHLPGFKFSSYNNTDMFIGEIQNERGLSGINSSVKIELIHETPIIYYKVGLFTTNVMQIMANNENDNFVVGATYNTQQGRFFESHLQANGIGLKFLEIRGFQDINDIVISICF